MPSLHELQTEFCRAMFEESDLMLADWIEPVEGLDVYRGNVSGNYSNALRDVYPTVAAIVGEAFFATAAREYSRSHASHSGDLHDFGESLGTFLRSWEPAAHLAYLEDVARLEWAIHRVFHAADAEPLDLQALAAVPPSTLAHLRFELHPAAFLIDSIYPLQEIWQISQPGATAGESVDLSQGGVWLLVIRRHRETEIERLSEGEYALLQALAGGATLGDAHERAVASEPAFDLEACLRRHVLGLTLVAFHSANFKENAE
jgi:hypothetical protein